MAARSGGSTKPTGAAQNPESKFPAEMLTVMNVAYPLAPVGRDAVGGAEQVLWQLDRALTAAGHRSIVVACQGSKTAGTLLQTPLPDGPFNEATREFTAEHHRKAINDGLSRWPVDLVHFHGVDFYRYLPPAGPPLLVTLHLPPHWYPQDIFQLQRPRTFLHCVSASQRHACPPCANLLDDIGNSAPQELFSASHAKRKYALALGRICPEKGFHIALESS